MKDKIFFDTNIICYAFDLNEVFKRGTCEKLIKRVLNGEIIGVVSNQVLGELFNAATGKLGVDPDKARILVQAIITSEKWEKVNYTYETINRAVEKFEHAEIPFWDLVIAETLKENGIKEIITENERDFRGVPGIKITNPFR
jgi:predicted nucleic acid-binding protein